jgi:heat shock protein HtpX
MLAGQAVADRRGMIWGLTLSLGLNASLFFFGHRRLLRLFPLVRLEGQDPWGLLPLVERLAQKAGVPTPEVYLTPLKLPTSWSAGSSWRNAKLVLSEGLIRELPLEQVGATVAFEIARIRRHDTLAIGMAVGLASSITYVYRSLQNNTLQNPFLRTGFQTLGRALEVPLKTVSAFLARCALNRTDVYSADAEAAQLIGQPNVWGQTLWNMSSMVKSRPLAVEWGDIAAFTVNPVTTSQLVRIFDPHPAPPERIRRLLGHFPI